MNSLPRTWPDGWLVALVTGWRHESIRILDETPDYIGWCCQKGEPKYNLGVSGMQIREAVLLNVGRSPRQNLRCDVPESAIYAALANVS
jgi:hypothetical protein